MLNMGVSLPRILITEITSSLPPNDYLVWSAVTAYAVGNRVITGGLVTFYECILAHTGQNPTNAGSIYWIRVGLVDALSVFDGSVATGPARNALAYYWRLDVQGSNAVAAFGFSGKNFKIWRTQFIGGGGTINKVLNSERFAATWTATGVSVAQTTPDDTDFDPVYGTYSAERLLENTATSAHQLTSTETRTYTATTSYTISIYAKMAVGTRNVRLTLPAAQFGIMACDFTLSGAGTAAPSAGGTGTITSLASGWYRCLLTATCTTTGTGNMGVISMLSGSTISYAGDGSSKLWIFGYQNNDGGVVTYEVTYAGRALFRTLEVTHTFTNPPSADINFGLYYKTNTRQSFIAKPVTVTAIGYYEVQVEKSVFDVKPYAGEIAMVVDNLVLGQIVYPLEDNLLDFSVKNRDDFGNITLLKRNSADDMNYAFNIDNANRTAIRNVLKSRLAMPLVFWDDDDMNDVRGLLQYAFINGYSMPYSPSCAWQTVTLDTEGLT